MSTDRLRVMFQDEAGFGRINKPKRCWGPKGVRPVVPCQHIREYVYAYGAVSPSDGELFSLVLPKANTICMNIFLEKLSKEYPDDHILLILDNCGWHTSGVLSIPANIELCPLLPYTPELNPIEQIWDEIREKGFQNIISHTLNDVVDHLCDTIFSLQNDPLRIRSITHREWALLPQV